MKACVLIEIADDGKVSVGTYPGELPPEMKQGMQPVASVDEGLAAAKQLLESGEGEDQPAQDTEPSEQTPQQAEGSFQGGFRKAQPAGPVGPVTGY